MFKSIFKAVAVSAVAAVFSIGCSGGDGGNTAGPSGGVREAKTYTGTAASGVTYTLKIEDGGGARAALTPTSGDKYTLTQTANSQKSTGTVKKVVGGELTLAPKEDPDDEFTATVSGDGITAMSGNITWDDGTANTAPVTLTPPNTGGGGGGKGDLQKWTDVTDSAFNTSVTFAIAYGNNRFIAVGSRGRIAYSANGASWTAVANSTFGTEPIEKIAYGGGRWIAMGSKMAYSDDNGVTWTAVSGSELPNYDIAYGNNRWVGVGHDGIAYSDDGINWTAVAAIWEFTLGGTTYTSTVTDIAYGNNRFVAWGDGDKMAYSDDNGVTWTDVSNSTLTEIEDIAFGNNRFVAVIGRRIAYSDNGISWTDVANSPFNGIEDIKGIAYGNNRFVAVADIGTKAYSEDNGVTWTAVENSGISGTFDIAYGNNRFVAVGTVKIAYADW